MADGSPTRCWVAVDGVGNLHLLIAVKEPVPALPVDMNGLSLRSITAEDALYLDIFAKFSHEVIFTPFCSQVLRTILIQRRDPCQASIACVREWQRAFKPVSRDLEASVQVGLFGELWTIWRVLIPVIGARAIHLWSGPLGERHDFVGSGCHLEVKTTRKDVERHDISRLDQLRVTEGKKLLLVSVRVEESIDGAETIATKRTEILEQLSQDAESVDVFEEKLRRIGWHEGLIQNGSLLRFNLRGVSVFDVSGFFPRFPDKFEAPKGVFGIKYSIDVTHETTMDTEEVSKILKTGMN